MTKSACAVLMFCCCVFSDAHAQRYDVIYFDGGGTVCSERDAEYYRVIEREGIAPPCYRVNDYFMSGQIEMSATFDCMNPYLKVVDVYALSAPTPNTKHGTYRLWYRNGNLRLKCDYVHDRADGVFEYYHENGQILTSVGVTQGIDNGQVRQWFPSGRIRCEGEHKNGYRHGRWTYFDAAGNVEREIVYEEGTCTNPKEIRCEFLSYLPREYEADKEKRWPVILFLHGSGLTGEGLRRIENGVQKTIVEHTDSCIVIAPSCAVPWSEALWLDGVLTEVLRKYRVDEDRVYLTGVSMGASATWELAVRHPRVFAAIAPLSGSVESAYVMQNVKRMKGIPVWTGIGVKNLLSINQKTEELIAALKSCGGDVTCIRHPDLAHNTWDATYGDPAFYEWLLKHRRSEGTD